MAPEKLLRRSRPATSCRSSGPKSASIARISVTTRPRPARGAVYSSARSVRQWNGDNWLLHTFHNIEESNHGLATGLQPDGQYGPIHHAGGRPGRRHAGRPWFSASQGAHRCSRGPFLRAVHRHTWLWHAGRHGGQSRLSGGPDRAASYRLDRDQHHLPAPAHRTEWQLPGAAGFDCRHHTGSPASAAADRLFLRGVL